MTQAVAPREERIVLGLGFMALAVMCRGDILNSSHPDAALIRRMAEETATGALGPGGPAGPGRWDFHPQLRDWVLTKRQR